MPTRKNPFLLLLEPGAMMVLMVGVKHMTWAWLLLSDGPNMVGVTSHKIPIAVFGGTTGAGLAYVLASTAVIVSFCLGGHDRLHLWRGFFHLSSSVVQQILLMVSAAGSFLAIWQGAYLDGTVVPVSHLKGDQYVYIFLALFHPLAVLLLYRPDKIKQALDRIWVWTDSKSSR